MGTEGEEKRRPEPPTDSLPRQKTHVSRHRVPGVSLAWARDRVQNVHERLLRREIDDDRIPAHVAIIQDGNRRFARKQGEDPTSGHSAGARKTAQVLQWCEEIGVKEVTLYALSTENFDRPDDELEHLFDLLAEKLREFTRADESEEESEIDERGIRVRAIGDLDRLPERVRDAVRDAERRTAGNDAFRLNLALAYGGRAELLAAARAVARDARDGRLDPEDVDYEEIETRLSRGEVRDVDLIVRTGGNERTSNFLPWRAAGNEAAAFFCAPYWPEFGKTDLLRGIRTYQAREESWQRTRAERAAALVGAVAETSAVEARTATRRLRDRLPQRAVQVLDAELAERGYDLDLDVEGGAGSGAGVAD